MRALAVLVLMIGALLIWSGITNGSITGLLGGVLSSGSAKKGKGK
jgi:hypothetical protein